MTTFLSFIFIIISILLILIVLVQRGRGGGLSGAFGGGGGGGSAFGTKTGDVFTTMTVLLFVVFMLMAIWLNFRFKGERETLTGLQTPTTQSATQAATMPAGAGAVAPPVGGTAATGGVVPAATEARPPLPKQYGQPGLPPENPSQPIPTH